MKTQISFVKNIRQKLYVLERNKKKILIKIEQVQSTMRLIKLKSINQNCFILNISNIFLKKNTLF